MVRFGVSSLLYDRTRFLISVGGVGLAIVLILLLRGVLDGTVQKATQYTERVGADLFVTQAGIEHMALAAPVIPAALEQEIAAVPGVQRASAIVRIPAIVDVGGTEVTASVVGFGPERALGGPWRMAAGSSQPSTDGLILDVTVAREHALRIGDPVSIAGHTFHVEGLSEQTNALAVGRVVFVRRDTATSVFLAPGLASFVLVKVVDGHDIAAVAQAIRAARPGLSVLTTATLVDSDRNLFRDLFGVPVNVMAFVGLLVGLLVIGLATYSAAAERTRDFGVLKAIGATNGYLYQVVIEIGVIIGAVGFATGILLSRLLAPLIIHIAPELGLVFEPRYVVRTLAIAMALSLVSVLLPAVRIARLDPKDAFG